MSSPPLRGTAEWSANREVALLLGLAGGNRYAAQQLWLRKERIKAEPRNLRVQELRRQASSLLAAEPSRPRLRHCSGLASGRFGWNLHGKTARSALYLTVKVAGGGPSVHACAWWGQIQPNPGTRRKNFVLGLGARHRGIVELSEGVIRCVTVFACYSSSSSFRHSGQPLSSK
jgi:hypothetical protein